MLEELEEQIQEVEESVNAFWGEVDEAECI